MSRCVIITAFLSQPLSETFLFKDEDFILCADRGFEHAIHSGIRPHALIGDFDSLSQKESKQQEEFEKSGGLVLRLPAEKDDTDTLYCLKYGIDRNFEEFYILGGLGGRFDHTLANLQTMSYAADHQKTIWILDGGNKITLRNPGTLTVPREKGYKLSLFSYGEFCEGVTICGVKYPLVDHKLTNSFPLGVSNEFNEDTAVISHTTGKLLVVLSRD